MQSAPMQKIFLEGLKDQQRIPNQIRPLGREKGLRCVTLLAFLVCLDVTMCARIVHTGTNEKIQ